MIPSQAASEQNAKRGFRRRTSFADVTEVTTGFGTKGIPKRIPQCLYIGSQARVNMRLTQIDKKGMCSDVH